MVRKPNCVRVPACWRKCVRTGTHFVSCLRFSACASCGCVFRMLANNAFTGTVPAGISALTNLDALYALALMPHRRRSTCRWPAVFMLAFLRHFVSCGCVIRMLTNNAFTGTIPAGISTLTNLRVLYALASMPRHAISPSSANLCTVCCGAVHSVGTTSAAVCPRGSPH